MRTHQTELIYRACRNAVESILTIASRVRFLRKCVLNLISCLLLLSLAYNSFGQVLQPQPLPCLILNQPEVDILYNSGGISHPECIETVSTLNFDPMVSYSVKAGDHITFKEGAYLAPNSSNQYHAYIEQSAFDLAWYGPSQSGTVGQFEKLEIGLQFEDAINDEILNFVDDLSGNKLNPFNPDEIDVYAEFFYSEPGVGYGAAQRINGFYYEEFDRQTDWVEVPTQHNFRFRFTPRKLGSYKCQITAVVNGHGTFHAAPFYFGCVASSSKDFVSVGVNKRYLKIGDEPFFPVGMNLFSHRTYINPNGSAGPVDRYIPESYDLYYADMTELASYEANYFRHIVCPWANEVEFEHVNNYSDRMDQSWEFDRMLDTAKSLDLLMHLDLQVHYAVEVPGFYYNSGWDWPKNGDSLLVSVCQFAADSGYCYRRLTNSQLPSAMLTNADAIQNYKYRLRYMIARWGFSNQIAILELFSEINNLGAKTKFVDDNGCFRPEKPDQPTDYGKQYTKEPGLISKVYNWQAIMCDYIKDSLQHTNHLLTVNYTGEPDSSDLSYLLSSVDLATFNNYGVGVNKGKTNFDQVAAKYLFVPSSKYIDKPLIHSEYGPGATGGCDGGTSFIKGLMIAPFVGPAAAINWDRQHNEGLIWRFIPPIKNLMEGIKLDQENWTPGEPYVHPDLKLEAYYLKSNYTGSNAAQKAVGVVSNRSWNYYTQGTALPCTDIFSHTEIANNSVYQNYLGYSSPGTHAIKLEGMGSLKGYEIHWIDALSGSSHDTTFATSDIFGKLELQFSGYLVGATPMLFFEVYPYGSNFKSLQLKGDDNNLLSETIEVNQGTGSIVIQPNPTESIANINIENIMEEEVRWSIIDLNGKVIETDVILNSNFRVDLSEYNSGIYFLKLEGRNNNSIHKIIKQ